MDIISDGLDLSITLGFFLKSQIVCIFSALLELPFLVQQFRSVFLVLQSRQEYKLEKKKKVSGPSPNLLFHSNLLLESIDLRVDLRCLESRYIER